MDCRLKCERPSEIVYTLTVTMTAGEWERLRDQMDQSPTSQSYPLWQVRREITDLLAQARKIYWPTTPKENSLTADNVSRTKSSLQSGE